MTKYREAIQVVMHQEQITVAQLAKRTELKEKNVSAIVQGNREPSLDELVKIASVLHLDMNMLLDIHANPQTDFFIENEVEKEINRIARAIPESQRGRFVKAVTFLAECFDNENEKNK